MFARLVRFLLHLFVGSPLPDPFESKSSHRRSSVQRNYLEFNSTGSTPIEGEIVWNNELLLDENSIGAAIDGPTLLFRVVPDYHSPNSSYYRDEDGESRPVRLDRSGLADAMLEDIAAEFLRANADAEAAPDALERDVISALRDTYSRELWRRAQRGAEQVHIGGRDYVIVPRGDGMVELIMTT
jgi:hypothetical protein